jgi:hypothetical protein
MVDPRAGGPPTACVAPVGDDRTPATAPDSTPVTTKHPPRDGGSVFAVRRGVRSCRMPPPLFGPHDADHPAGANAPKSVTRSCTCGTERTSDWGSLATAPCEGHLPAAQTLRAEDPSRLTSIMFGGVQLALGRVKQCCFFAPGGNLEPPPPMQHDAHAHRGSDHHHSRGRGRPPVRDQGGQDGNAHAGQDRMPLGARSPLHVFTLTAVEHHELTPWIRFGNRQSVHELATKADGATTSSSRTRPIRSRSTNRSDPSPNLSAPAR